MTLEFILSLANDSNDNKKNLLTCPVLLNKDNKPQKWGYCPENPIITKKRLDVKNINTVGDKINYFEGTCKFPYMMNKYNLIYYYAK